MHVLSTKKVSRTVSAGAVAILFLLFLARSFPAVLGGIDFPDFYCAGVLARERLEIYDAQAQQHCQVREAGRTGTYYIHPPFEALLFVPLARLPLRQAYLLWTCFGLLLLATSVRSLLRHRSQWRLDWQLAAPLGLLFPPLLLNFVQGQDSLLLLGICVFALESLEQRSFFQEGAILGLGLLKFHLVLPLALLLLIRGRLRFAAGFLTSMLILAAVSFASFGSEIFADYARFLEHWPDLPNSGMHWEAMANVRGLVALFMLGDSLLTSILVAAASLILLVLGAWCWHVAGGSLCRQRLAFSVSIVTSLLVSYHLSPHDLTLLLIPLITLVEIGFQQGSYKKSVLLGLAALIFLPPIHIVVLYAKYYVLMVIPILVVLTVLVWTLAQSSKYDTSQTAIS